MVPVSAYAKIYSISIRLCLCIKMWRHLSWSMILIAQPIPIRQQQSRHSAYDNHTSYITYLISKKDFRRHTDKINAIKFPPIKLFVNVIRFLHDFITIYAQPFRMAVRTRYKNVAQSYYGNRPKFYLLNYTIHNRFGNQHFFRYIIISERSALLFNFVDSQLFTSALYNNNNWSLQQKQKFPHFFIHFSHTFFINLRHSNTSNIHFTERNIIFYVYQAFLMVNPF